MLKRIILIFTLLLCSHSIALAKEKYPEEIQQFDLRYYNPINFGLKDLVFEARITGLLETLNKQKSYGLLTDLYFKIYWIFPGKFHVDVFGLPNGFHRVKRELSNIIKTRLDYVIPQKLASKLRSYSIKKKKVGNRTQIKALDESHMRTVSEMHFYFKRKGVLEEVKTFSPVGSNKAKLSMEVKQWSHNKLVLSGVETESMQGMQKTIVNSDIKYMTVKGFGFPKQINSQTTYELVLGNKKETKSGAESEIIFSKFEVNTKKAARKIIGK
jgi:hypothetical protein